MQVLAAQGVTTLCWRAWETPWCTSTLGPNHRTAHTRPVCAGGRCACVLNTRAGMRGRARMPACTWGREGPCYRPGWASALVWRAWWSERRTRAACRAAPGRLRISCLATNQLWCVLAPAGSSLFPKTQWPPLPPPCPPRPSRPLLVRFKQQLSAAWRSAGPGSAGARGALAELPPSAMTGRCLDSLCLLVRTSPIL